MGEREREETVNCIVRTWKMEHKTYQDGRVLCTLCYCLLFMIEKYNQKLNGETFKNKEREAEFSFGV